jgi:acyl-CoA thioester hydrolase
MADPAEPFELPIHVEPGDIDELGHVNNVTYLRWVQDAAVAHWTAAAPAAEQARLFWIVLRHEIDYLHPAHLEDRLAAFTWVGTGTRLRYDRHTEIRRVHDGRVLARARTVWCPIDAATRKPTPVSAEVRARFSVPATSPESAPASDPY